MDDDLVTFRLLIVSEAVSERELIRRAAMQARVSIDIVEDDAGQDAAAARAMLAQRDFDLVFFDSRVSKTGRQKLLDAVHAARNRPLAILIGAAEMKTREVLTDGLAVDGLLAKPIEEDELADLIASCVSARLPKRVLIIDDSSTVRSVVRKVLQASHFQLASEEASEGTSAIEQAKQQNYDIMFLDCHMPGLDGFATLDELRKQQPDSKIVMMTGTRDIRIEDRARAGGAADFLYKPFFPQDIDAVLNRLFGLMRHAGTDRS